MPDYQLRELPKFGDEELANVLDGAPLREDIQRYHARRDKFLEDQEAHKGMIEERLPARIDRIFNRPLRSLFGDEDSPRDPHEAVNEVLQEVVEVEFQIEEWREGERASKLDRRHEALLEVHGQLSRRVGQYTGNRLATERALNVLLDDGDNPEGQTDAEPAGELEARQEAADAG